ncbi:hypothetical protein B9X92_02560 [Acinetobacter baumannii]|nr:hypothetical protein B9X92_02560 [Acinetobacter baumannii]OTL85934.1 hypothetical protein B9X60_18030 [Acinetobacter baumannii]OTS70457.1 hypothetical protein CAS97_09770 [Acinetobacter baumannii]
MCRLLHLKIISLKNPLQIGLCNKAVYKCKTMHSSKRLKKSCFLQKKKVSSTHRDVELLL